MLTNSTRRWLAGLGVAGAFVAASATPAVAEAAPFEILTHDLLVAPGYSSSEWLYVSPTDHEGEYTFGKTTLDVDLSKVKDFATVEPMLYDWVCDTSPSKLHCETDLAEGEQPWFDYVVTAKDTATPGQKGDLSVTVTSNGKTTTATAGVTIAEGVDLQSDPTVEVSGAPGSRVGLPGAVRNGALADSEGAVLVVQADYLSPYVGDFSNCTSYYDGTLAVCTFDNTLKSEKMYRLSEDLPLGVSADARTGAVIWGALDWRTKDDWALAVKDWALEDGKPGTGGELRLDEVEAAAAKAAQTDVDRWNNFTEATVKVTGDNQADLATKGAVASGKVGDVVTVRPSFTNLGPALLEYQMEELPVRITIPEGTTAVEASGECVPYIPGEEWDPWNGDWGKPGAAEYACFTSETPKDMEYPYEFGLRIDKVIPDATGTITVKLAGDPNSKNDTAKIVINPTSDQGDGGQGGGEDGDGGSLPITGESTGLIAGIGALLLAAGVGGYLVAKRRRTRFVA